VYQGKQFGSIPRRPGVYCLVISVLEPVDIEVGRLGTREFKPGCYVYIGSALGRSANLRSRISWHLRTSKSARWHIDRLLSSGEVTIEAVIYSKSDYRVECELCHSLGNPKIAQSPVRGFGSSDCRQGCVSHIVYFQKIDPVQVRMMVADRFRALGLNPETFIVREKVLNSLKLSIRRLGVVSRLREGHHTRKMLGVVR